jgi:hypothetical protein
MVYDVCELDRCIGFSLIPSQPHWHEIEYDTRAGWEIWIRAVQWADHAWQLPLFEE